MNTLIVRIADDRVDPGTEYYDFYIACSDADENDSDCIKSCIDKLRDWHAARLPLVGSMETISPGGRSMLLVPAMLGNKLGPTKISTLYRLALLAGGVIKEQRLITQAEFERSLEFKIV